MFCSVQKAIRSTSVRPPNEPNAGLVPPPKLPPEKQKGQTYSDRWLAYKNVVFTSSRGGS